MAGPDIAARIRQRLKEIGLSESKAAAQLGWTRGVLSATMRRLDKGGGLNTDTLPALERVLGVSATWLLTGEHPSGTRLDALDEWAAAAALAKDRYGLTDEQLARVGAFRAPASPRYLDAAVLRALADIL